MEELQLEYVPSPQSNRYSTGCPWLQLAPPLEYSSDCPTSSEDGPDGLLGVETVWAGAVIVTDLEDDQLLTTDGSEEHRACALTWYVPGLLQLLLAVVEELQEEYVPSPQSNQYCTECPSLQLAPPVE